MGNTENIALGSDFDETVEVPFNAAGLSQLTEGLLDSGFSDSEIREIMGGDAIRVFAEVLPSRDVME